MCNLLKWGEGATHLHHQEVMAEEEGALREEEEEEGAMEEEEGTEVMLQPACWCATFAMIAG